MKKLQSISKNLSGLVLVVLCTALLSACCHCKIQKSIITQWCSQPYSEFPSDSSIILWRKPGVSHEAFERWKREHHLPTGQAICTFCGDDEFRFGIGLPPDLSHRQQIRTQATITTRMPKSCSSCTPAADDV